MNKHYLAGVVIGLAAVVSGSVSAQEFPSRAIRIIVPFAAGGGSDIIGRVLAQKMSENMKQPVIVENKPGAGGSIGTQEVAKSAPDGYTLVLATSSTHGVNPWLYSRLPYDPIKDFSPISMLATIDYALAVSPQSKLNSVADLLNQSKTGQVTYGSSGNGTTGHLSGALLGAMGKANLTHIPYKGSPQALNDVMGGQITFMFDNTSVLAPHAKAGKVKLLATTGGTRSRVSKDVPTLAESGMPDYKVIGWWTLLAPANTPKAIVDKLNREVVKAMAVPEVKDRLNGAGNDVLTTTPEETRAYIESELKKFKEIVALSGARVD